MKKLVLALMLLGCVQFAFGDTTERGFIGKEDRKLWTGTTSRTFSRDTSTSGSQTLTKIGNKVDVEGVFGTDLAALSDACSASSTERTLILGPRAWAITDDITFPSHVTLEFVNGATFNISSTKTVTIAGDIIAGPYQQIVSGSGLIVFGSNSVQYVYPGWWGAVGDGSTDDATNLQAAAVAAGTAGVTLWISQGTYLIINEINVTSDVDGPGTIEADQTNWAGTDSNTQPLMWVMASGVSIKNITIDCDGDTIADPDAPVGLRVKDYDNVTIDGITIKEAGGKGLILTRSHDTVIQNCHIDGAGYSDIAVVKDSADGIYSNDSFGIRIINNHIEDFTRCGIVSEGNGTTIWSTNPYIADNYVHNGHSHTNGEPNGGIWVESTNGFHIEGNTIYDISGDQTGNRGGAGATAGDPDKTYGIKATNSDFAALAGLTNYNHPGMVANNTIGTRNYDQDGTGTDVTEIGPGIGILVKGETGTEVLVQGNQIYQWESVGIMVQKGRLVIDGNIFGPHEYDQYSDNQYPDCAILLANSIIYDVLISNTTQGTTTHTDANCADVLFEAVSSNVYKCEVVNWSNPTGFSLSNRRPGQSPANEEIIIRDTFINGDYSRLHTEGRLTLDNCRVEWTSDHTNLSNNILRGEEIYLRDNYFEGTDAQYKLIVQENDEGTINWIQMNNNVFDGIYIGNRTSTVTYWINDNSTFIDDSTGCSLIDTGSADTINMIISGMKIFSNHASTFLIDVNAAGDDITFLDRTYVETAFADGQYIDGTNQASVHGLFIHQGVTVDPANLAATGDTTSNTATVSDAAVGDSVIVYPPYDMQQVVYSAYVSAANTVEIVFLNQNAGAVNLASGTWLFDVIKK